jgi:hypothetical protein
MNYTGIWMEWLRKITEIQCPGLDSNRISKIYEPKALLFESPSSVHIFKEQAYIFEIFFAKISTVDRNKTIFKMNAKVDVLITYLLT